MATNNDASNSGVFSILITQCLQNDYMAPIGPADPLPSLVHIGYREAERLLGTEKHHMGPLREILDWADNQDPEKLMVIHIREQHDAANKDQAEHLQLLGTHCISGSWGARSILDLEDNTRRRNSNTIFLNTASYNDCRDTNILEIIETARTKRPNGTDLRIGVIGVWTDAKVSFLLYDLKTRHKAPPYKLSTCSALTAGSSRNHHFHSLDQLRGILGISVYDNVASFAEFLVPTCGGFSPPAMRNSLICPAIEFSSSSSPTPTLSPEDRLLVCHLFRGCSRVKLRPLGGGRSGTLVFRATSWDPSGEFEYAPCVVKLGPRDIITRERVNSERVADVLGNHAPSLKALADYGSRSGIKFAYASMAGKKTSGFDRQYGTMATQHVLRVIDVVLKTILGQFYRAASFERLDLLAHYDFDGKGWSWSSGGSDTPAAVGSRIRELMRLPANVDLPRWLEFPGNIRKPNVYYYLTEDLPRLRSHTQRSKEMHLVSLQHGDLHGGNIMMDSQQNIWLIDFYYTDRAHILKDPAKLENDVLYQFTEVNSEKELEEALSITRVLWQVQDLGAPLPETACVQGLSLPGFVKAYETVRRIRHHVNKMVGSERAALPMNIALLRYALVAMTYPHLSPLQRKWALAAACGYADNIVAAYHKSEGEIIVHWLPREQLFPEPLTVTPGRLGMTITPGKWGRSMDKDVAALAAQGVRRLVVLATEEEMRVALDNDQHGADGEEAEYGKRVSAHAIKFLWRFCAPESAPSVDVMHDIVSYVLQGLRAGEDVAVASWAGQGRSGTVAACVLLTLKPSLTADEAVALVKQLRGSCRAVESDRQWNLIREYALRRAEEYSNKAKM